MVMSQKQSISLHAFLVVIAVKVGRVSQVSIPHKELRIYSFFSQRKPHNSEVIGSSLSKPNRIWRSGLHCTPN